MTSITDQKQRARARIDILISTILDRRYDDPVVVARGAILLLLQRMTLQELTAYEAQLNNLVITRRQEGEPQ